MSSPPPSVRALQAASIATLTSAAGLGASLSFFVVPRLLESPTPVLIRQFARTLSAARAVLPPSLAAAGLAQAYLAYRLPAKARLYAAAAVMSLSIFPYTSFVMLPINRMMLAKARAVESNELLAAEEELTAAEARTAHALVDSWALRNLYRPAVAFTAGVIGLHAALS
ncbi:hypothetical protein GGR52DRAFT_284357 [Hypoxylon sp. FL1284]|nr:hypothetical protein GGR52DRAFT_284357 [Hypoxylon sp. FL1284]